MDPEHVVQSLRILNFDAQQSTIAPPELLTKQISDEQYILSDTDDKLIILIIFREVTDLDSITLHAINMQKNNQIDASPPKMIHIYKINNVNIDSNDIQSMQPIHSFKCEAFKLSMGQNIKLKITSKHSEEFSKIKYLAIYIESNLRNTKKTILNGIEFITAAKHKYNQVFKDPFQAIFNLSSQITNIMDTISHKCICGDYLREINGMTEKLELYNGEGYHCDVCRKQSYEVEIFWHCNKGQVSAHPGGFDVCNDCVGTYKPDTYTGPQGLLTGIKDSFGMNYEIKYKPASTQYEKIEVKNVAIGHLPFNLALKIHDVTVLGSDPDINTIYGNKLIWNGQVTSKSYIVSEIAEKLTIFIEFSATVKLFALTVHISPESVQYIQQNDTDSSDCKISRPDKILVYKVEHIADIFDLDPEVADKTFDITTSKTEIRNISKELPKFKNTEYLAIVLTCDEEKDERIYVNAIECQGEDSKEVKDDEIQENESNSDNQNDEKLPTTFSNENILNNSTYLLESNVLSTEECNHSNVSDCPYLKRLIAVLDKHTQFVEQGGKANDNIADKKQQQMYLNDFNHLLFAHSRQFEDIHELLFQCDLSDCVMMRRNNRNRSLYRSNDRKLEQMYFDCKNIEDINSQQIFDKIHCYYLHSFDIGYKLRRKNIKYLQNLVENDEKEDVDNICYDKITLHINESQLAKRQSCRKVKGLERIYNHTEKSKFCTKVNAQNISYSNGIRYFYWKPYKNNHNVTDTQRWIGTKTDTNKYANEGYTLGQWYIEAVFANLKEELINNPICSLSKKQWDILKHKVNIHILTHKAKGIKCKKCMSDAIYNIKYQDPIQQDHLIAMMVYCNQDTLQRKFTETYRRIPNDESDESIIKRHSNYAHLGRLLREFVECFGVDIKLRKWSNNGVEMKQRFWHGITIKANFSSSVICIKGPVSTSSDYSVATNFCANKGLILELVLDKYWCHEMSGNGVALVECCWISDFTNEHEAFFIGGYSNFIINTIIDPNGINYGKYVGSMNKWHQLFMCKYKQDYMISQTNDKILNLIACRMLSHELHSQYPNNGNFHEFKSMPLYVRNLMHCQLKAIETIEINYDILFDTNKGIEYFFRKCFLSDEMWVYWDRLAEIFPSLMQINITVGEYINVYCENEMIYETILFHLKTNQTLKVITIYIAGTVNMVKLQLIWAKYDEKFDKIKWKMSVNESGIDLRFTDKLHPLFNE